MWISLSTIRAISLVVVPLFSSAVVGWHPDAEKVNSMMYEEFGNGDYMNRDHLGLTHGTVTPRLTTSTVVCHGTATSCSNIPAITNATTTLDSTESTTTIVATPSFQSQPTHSPSLAAEKSDFNQPPIAENQEQETTDLPATSTMSNFTVTSLTSSLPALSSTPLVSLTSVSFVSTTLTPSTTLDPTDTEILLDSTTTAPKSTSTPDNEDEKPSEEETNSDEEQNNEDNEDSEDNEDNEEDQSQQDGGRNTVTSLQYVTNTPTDAAGAEQTGDAEVAPVVQSGENAAPKLSAGAWMCVMLGLGSVVAGML